MRIPAMCVLLVALLVTCGWAQDDGLLAWYKFDAQDGLTTADASGHGNDGTLVGRARVVDGALDLDGADGYVDCGPGLDISRKGSFSFWCKPRAAQGGLVNWSTGGSWSDERLVLAVNTYGGGANLVACIADGGSFQQIRGFGQLGVGEWSHFVVAFDGERVQVYRDGLLAQSTSQNLAPGLAGVPLWIGRCQGLGAEIFDGLLDEVRIYDRALTSVDVLTQYREEAPSRGKDMTAFERVTIEASAYSGPGRLVASLDARAMRPLPDDAQLLAVFQEPNGGPPILVAEIPEIPEDSPAEVIFDLQQVPPGDYELGVRVVGFRNRPVGNRASVPIRWNGQPEAFKGVHILNNVVWELLNVKGDALTGSHSFRNPTERWVFLRATAEIPEGGALRLRLRGPAGAEEVIRCDEAGSRPIEAMRFLPAGEYTLDIRAQGGTRLQQLIARSVPMLQHAFYGANPHIAPYGPYDWDFLRKDVLPNVNVMIGPAGAEIDAWKASGRKWISITGILRPAEDDPAALDSIYEGWSSAIGMQHPLMDGIIIDEFGGGDQPIYDLYRQAIERIYADPKFAGRSVSPYGGTFYGKDRSAEFARVAVEGGGYMCWEVYLQEQPDEPGARGLIRRAITDQMPLWEARFPDAASKMCLVLGYMSQPTESLNIDPGVDYKVFMDMQFRALATHPSLFGLGGVQEYHSSYCDEENVRWAGRLYRHYCIEGNTEPLTSDPYALPHIANADFAEDTTAWTLDAAEEGSVSAETFAGYGWLEGRYPRTNRGDTFLLMRRSADGPNTVSQEIKQLTPGRLYSLKAITSDYQDLVNEVSRRAENAVSISIEGVEMLEGPKLSFQYTFPNCYAHTLGKFDAKYPYFMNYNWRVFRATSETAQLTISDWAKPDEPGGPVGQETMLNFIEVQPYIGE